MAKQDAPRADAEPVRTTWKLVPSVQVDQQALERAADQQARFLIATNELSADKLSDEALLAVYKGQGSVERGFRFFERSPLPGFLRLREEAKPSDRPQLHYGALFAGLSPR